MTLRSGQCLARATGQPLARASHCIRVTGVKPVAADGRRQAPLTPTLTGARNLYSRISANLYSRISANLYSRITADTRDRQPPSTLNPSPDKQTFPYWVTMGDQHSRKSCRSTRFPSQ